MYTFTLLAITTLSPVTSVWPASEVPRSEAPEVTLQTIGDSPLRGTIVGWTLAGELVLDDPAEDSPISLRSDEIVRVTCAPLPAVSPRGSTGKARPSGRALVFELIGGDRLNGVVVDGSANDVTLMTVACGRVTIPLEYIAAVYTPAAATPRWASVLGELRRKGPASDDCLVLANGDVLRGFLHSIEATRVTLDQNDNPVAVPADHVVAALLVPTPPPQSDEALRARITLTDGGRLTASGFEWSGEAVELTVFGERKQSVPVERIAQVDVSGGRWVLLSALTPISEQHTPLLDLPWPRTIDTNVLGRPIRVAGQTHERGVGVHSASALTFDLAGAYREFVTSFGMDDDSGSFADVSVEIRVDGAPRFKKDHVRFGELHGPVRLDLTSANRLDLIVNFGDNGDVQDRFDWVEAGLVR